ncbi:DapH/DapD/GlmU-related protein [Demequina sp. NBRC 110051]|uniref:acyltransferase n=1 Tax=Demequina sp. NBRC 110051 TaxID=1570340 RepID=UPI0021013996|nr:acyltransferase [Demequina sp. NBRC 110051]
MRRRYGRDILVSVASARVLPHRLRPLVLRRCGVEVGVGCQLREGIIVDNATSGDLRLRVGQGTYINSDARIDTAAPVTIGAEVSFGPGVRIVTTTHALGTSDKRAGELTSRPVTIGDGSWLGAGVMVLPGVTIARGCVVAAGAVVTKDTEPDGLYGGVPARRIRDLEPSERPSRPATSAGTGPARPRRAPTPPSGRR